MKLSLQQNLKADHIVLNRSLLVLCENDLAEQLAERMTTSSHFYNFKMNNYFNFNFNDNF